MANNNHLSNLTRLLRTEREHNSDSRRSDIYGYARSIAAVEKVIAVVSNLYENTSRIFDGGFAAEIGLDGYDSENSIWEKRILSLMPQSELDNKLIAELRFYHFLRHRGKSRANYHLMTRLRFSDGKGGFRDILHRLYYIYGHEPTKPDYAICLYGPLYVEFPGNSLAVNSITGYAEELCAESSADILSRRELQVLRLIDSGLRSQEIAGQLNISLHTVNRHRQNILAAMQVKNSMEACRLARSAGLL
ncbi:MAG: helix-turn-helix transcriptional regulator [Muribaculaceae bacterium]|nr:helix-turn-helix transcriptional regulator [Muribaculaceae bacterium]MDE6131679.1 helix-turn-helix transcriptional regulator [Muribaculaceae bacterium]